MNMDRVIIILFLIVIFNTVYWSNILWFQQRKLRDEFHLLIQMLSKKENDCGPK